MLTIKLMSLLPAPKPALCTVYQQSTELEILFSVAAIYDLGKLLLKFLDHTHSVGILCTSDQSVAQAATYTKHNKHNRPINMPSGGSELATPEIKWLQNYNLDRTVTGNQRLQWTRKCSMQRKHTDIAHKIIV